MFHLKTDRARTPRKEDGVSLRLSKHDRSRRVPICAILGRLNFTPHVFELRGLASVPLGE